MKLRVLLPVSLAGWWLAGRTSPVGFPSLLDRASFACYLFAQVFLKLRLPSHKGVPQSASRRQKVQGETTINTLISKWKAALSERC